MQVYLLCKDSNNSFLCSFSLKFSKNKDNNLHTLIEINEKHLEDCYLTEDSKLLKERLKEVEKFQGTIARIVR